MHACVLVLESSVDGHVTCTLGPVCAPVCTCALLVAAGTVGSSQHTSDGDGEGGAGVGLAGSSGPRGEGGSEGPGVDEGVGLDDELEEVAAAKAGR